MRLSKHLVTLLVMLAGFAYSIEATLPALSAVLIENSSEEKEASEKTESLVPAQTEAKRVKHDSTIEINRHSNVKFSTPRSGKQHFIKPSSIILHRRLLI